MKPTYQSYCGTQCDKCKYREKMNCPGCLALKGNLFWGKCKIAKCCIDKKVDHCGKCSEFPCDLLNSYSYDEKEGDNGKRIENLRNLK